MSLKSTVDIALAGDGSLDSAVKKVPDKNTPFFLDDLPLSERMDLINELGLNAHVNPDGSFFFYKPTKYRGKVCD